MSEYSEIIGKQFRPTFESNIDHFKIRGYDDKRAVVLTVVYPKEGEPFDSEIEAKALLNALKIGEYKSYNRDREKFLNNIFTLYNKYTWLLPNTKPREVIFHGNLCIRCKHKFGDIFIFCHKHQYDEKCYKFKLDK